MRRTLLLLGAALATSPARTAGAQDGLLARVEVGSINADDPFSATLAFGGLVGWTVNDRSTALVRLLRQSRSRSTGADLTSRGRTYWLVGYERQGRPAERFKQQTIFRAVGGRLTQKSFRSAWVLGAAFVQRIRLTETISIVGNIEDLVAFLPDQTVEVCEASTGCVPVDLRGKVQHNFGLVVAFEARR